MNYNDKAKVFLDAYKDLCRVCNLTLSFDENYGLVVKDYNREEDDKMMNSINYMWELEKKNKEESEELQNKIKIKKAELKESLGNDKYCVLDGNILDLSTNDVVRKATDNEIKLHFEIRNLQRMLNVFNY